MPKLAVALALLAAAGCGGGSGSGGAASGALGSAVVLVADAPPVDLDGFTVTIEKATLLGGDAGPVVIYEGEKRVDLLEHRDQELLLSVCDLPAGSYEKIRLEIRDAEVSPNPNGWPVFVPGGGKLDLNPRGEFTIVAGETTQIRIDVDVARSLHVVLTGNQRFIVRPVIFVDIEGGPREPVAVTDLAGSIVATDPAAPSLTVDLDAAAGTIEVRPAAGVSVFDEALEEIAFADLAVGDRVLLRGAIDSGGVLEAAAILVGDPLRIRGTLPDGSAAAEWPFEPDAGEPLVGATDAAAAAGARAFIESGPEIDPASLPAGSRARLTGRYFATESLLRAALLDLESETIAGTISAVDLVSVPPRFTIDDGSLAPPEVAFDAETEFPIAGGGEATPEFLRAGLEVEAETAGEIAGLPRAWKVRIEPLHFEGVVQSIDLAAESITILPAGGGAALLLELRPEARVLHVDGAFCTELELDDLFPGDAIEASGLLDAADVPQIWLVVVE
jgi:hypothetical protein